MTFSERTAKYTDQILSGWGVDVGYGVWGVGVGALQLVLVQASTPVLVQASLCCLYYPIMLMIYSNKN